MRSPALKTATEHPARIFVGVASAPARTPTAKGAHAPLTSRQEIDMANSRTDAYRKANPLGGPATVFRAIAGRLEAGEDYYAVLEDYGLVHSESAARPSSPEEQVTKPAGDVFGSCKEKEERIESTLATVEDIIWEATASDTLSGRGRDTETRHLVYDSLCRAGNLVAWTREQLAAAQSATAPLPKEAPIELLVSMALRMNHGFGLDDARSQEVQISDMRKVYEEVSGHGFYSEKVKGRYTAMLRVSSGSESKGQG